MSYAIYQTLNHSLNLSTSPIYQSLHNKISIIQPYTIVYFILVFLLPLLAYTILQKSSSTSSSQPAEKQLPTPRGLPLIGNVLSIPREHSWIKFHQWGKELGPIYKLNILGQTHVVISDDKIAQALLGERGVIYSDRPWFNFASGLLTRNLHILLLSYNDRFKRYRKFLHSLLSNTTSLIYTPAQETEAIRLLSSLIASPATYDKTLDRFSASLATRLIYGKRVVTGDEPFLATLHDITHTLEHVGSPGSHFCDWIPALMWLPEWMAPFKRQARRLHDREATFFKSLVDETRVEMRAASASGKAAPPSFASKLIEEAERPRDETNPDGAALSGIEGAYLLGVAFEAGADTTAAQMKSFLLALCLHPEWQARMAEELTSVVGDDRLPSFADVPQLPVTRAVMVEAARWRPASPGGFPHVLSQDDAYGGVVFKKGTVFHPNTWAIVRDPSMYPDPESFNPARWLDPAYPMYRTPLTQFPNLVATPVFGYGRRQCPGLYLAERSLFLGAAYVGWGVEVGVRWGREGGKVLDYDFTSGLAPAPRWWGFDLKIRGEGRGEIIRKMAEEGEKRDPLRER